MYRTVARQGADTQNEDVFISEALKNPHQDRPPTYPEAPITTKAVHTDGSQARPSAVRPLQAIEDGHSNLIGNRDLQEILSIFYQPIAVYGNLV